MIYHLRADFERRLKGRLVRKLTRIVWSHVLFWNERARYGILETVIRKNSREVLLRSEPEVFLAEDLRETK